MKDMTKTPLTEYQKLQLERVTEAAVAQAAATSRMKTVMAEAHESGVSLQDVADHHPDCSASTAWRWVTKESSVPQWTSGLHNDQLFRWAHRLRRSHPVHEVEGMVRSAAAAMAPKMPASEVELIIAALHQGDYS